MVSLEEMKLPPNNQEAEMCFLCSVYLDPLILQETDVVPDRFYSEWNKIIFGAMLELSEEKKVIDMVTLTSKLPIEYRDHLYDISTMVLTPSNRKTYQEILEEDFMKRKLIKSAKEVLVGVYDGMLAVDIHARLTKSLEKVLIAEPGETADKTTLEVVEDMGVKRSYICKYGYEKFDKVLGGYKEGQIVVIGARPGIGKTALMLELVQRILSQKVKVAIYSLEMQNKELAKRLLSNWARIDMQEIDHVNHQKVLREARSQKVEELSYLRRFDGGFTHKQLESSIRKSVYQEGSKIVFIDHLGLIQGQGKILRNERIGSVTSSLKTLAKELKITIVVLSQLNRESAKKYDAPQLESLRDSGNIEQDADIVIMPHRDRDKDPEDDNYDLTKMEVFIRKNRNGKLGIIRMNTEMQYMSITEDTTTMAKKSIPRKTKDDENDLPF